MVEAVLTMRRCVRHTTPQPYLVSGLGSSADLTAVNRPTADSAGINVLSMQGDIASARPVSNATITTVPGCNVMCSPGYAPPRGLQ